MTSAEIVRHRLHHQQIAQTKFRKPHEIVSWLGAMQSQEFALAKWAIALRLPNDNTGMPALNNSDIEKAFNTGKNFRTTFCAQPGTLWRRRIFAGCWR